MLKEDTPLFGWHRVIRSAPYFPFCPVRPWPSSSVKHPPAALTRSVRADGVCSPPAVTDGRRRPALLPHVPPSLPPSPECHSPRADSPPGCVCGVKPCVPVTITWPGGSVPSVFCGAQVASPPYPEPSLGALVCPECLIQQTPKERLVETNARGLASLTRGPFALPRGPKWKSSTIRTGESPLVVLRCGSVLIVWWVTCFFSLSGSF